MSLVLSGLTGYVDENKMPLIKKSVLEGRAMNYVTVQSDIKSAAAINIFDSELVLQAGACGWNAEGDTELSQKILSVCDLKVNESMCIDKLEAYYTQKSMKPGSYNEELPFEGIYAEDKAESLQNAIGDLIWNGNTDTGTGNLALCDGFIKLIDEKYSGATVDGNTGSETGITSNNIIAIVDAMVAAVPTDIIDSDDLKMFVGYDFYRMYTAALRAANLFHVTGENGAEFKMFVPGTNVELVALKPLNGSNRAFITRVANLYVGTDLLNDAENFEIWYSRDNDEVRFKSKFKVGVEIAFEGFVVEYTNK